MTSTLACTPELPCRHPPPYPTLPHDGRGLNCRIVKRGHEPPCALASS